MSKDTIYREDAVKILTENVTFEFIEDKEWAITCLQNLSSADRPQGEWKPKNHHTDYCSNCGFEETQWRTADYNFCPSCGVRMKGADDD